MIPLKILVTAGPTCEAIDPVRFITNRSTGCMGYAIAARGARAGHKLTLISGPVCLKPPDGVKTVYITTAREMFAEVKRHIKGKHCLIMAAAVADFRPAFCARQKIKKTNMPRTISLRRNPDILAWAGAHKSKMILAGFCMETQNLLTRAKRKQILKNVDFMVANKIEADGVPFGHKPASFVLFGPDGRKVFLQNASKEKIAGILLDKIQGMWYKRNPGRNAAV
ncbi:MAG: phosphopantothenoylcysteine decarboxylase [Candidatus Omnitrophica bacterium]|jgi:phosphopantothenoylcysteine decarboxylase/phosphopantothenate--cysteine ligase|nr:phosphopantothenoylcysteine decarboxylase [Candidatus Omnitrophota bacterium]